LGVEGGGGDLRRGVLQALQIEMLLGRMGPSSKGEGVRGDVRKARLGRLLAREARLEMVLDLERVVGVEGSWTLFCLGAMLGMAGFWDFVHGFEIGRGCEPDSIQ
jgi:hypothetical protein